MKSILFVILIAQFVLVLIYSIPLIVPGKYGEIRVKQRDEGLKCLLEFQNSENPMSARILNGLKTLVLAIDIWPFRASVVHLCLFFLTIKFI